MSKATATRQSRQSRTRQPLDGALLAHLRAILSQAGRGHLDADCRLLAPLFRLMADALDGDLAGDALELADHYEAEAASLSSCPSDQGARFCRPDPVQRHILSILHLRGGESLPEIVRTLTAGPARTPHEVGGLGLALSPENVRQTVEHLQELGLVEQSADGKLQLTWFIRGSGYTVQARNTG